MDRDTVLVLNRFGMGEAPADLQRILIDKFLRLLVEGGAHPGKLLFYADGIKLACEGSPVLGPLRALQAAGVELVLCSTCLVYFGMKDRVAVGIPGGMPDIIEAMGKAGKVISL